MEIKKILTQILEEGFGILYANPDREIKATYSEGNLTIKETHQCKVSKFEQAKTTDQFSPYILELLFGAISAAVNVYWDDCTNYHKYFCGQRLSLIEVLYNKVSYATLAKLGNLVYTPSDHLLEELYCNFPEIDDDIFQVFIIDKPLYNILTEYTNEYVCYSETTETFLWGITHAHTNWEYVFTEIEI